MKHIIFTVTNDLSYDQRMMRICSSLANNGFEATIVGVAHNKSTALTEKKYKQKRLPCYFKKGYFFYAEYNIRLFFFLLFAKADAFAYFENRVLIPKDFITIGAAGSKLAVERIAITCVMKIVK